MEELMLFTDGSVNVQSKIGYGAYLVAHEHDLSIETLKTSVKVKRFEETSSTKLELQTLLWAFSEIDALKKKIIVYTDSQNIISLLERRERLEQNNYYSKKNTLINNAALYREFYSITDKLDCSFIKVRGHQKQIRKTNIEKLFTIVDRVSRHALRNE